LIKETKMKRNSALVVILLILISFVGGYFVGFRYPIGITQPNSHILLTRTADYLLNNFYKPISEEQLIKGMVNSLNDPYTVFMNPEETKALQEEVKGEYAGIGVIINKNEKLNYPEIVSVFKDSPAEKSGLLKGDIIVEVDGKSTFKGIL
jgi:Periplasmic protease